MHKVKGITLRSTCIEVQEDDGTITEIGYRKIQAFISKNELHDSLVTLKEVVEDYLELYENHKVVTKGNIVVRCGKE